VIFLTTCLVLLFCSFAASILLLVRLLILFFLSLATAYAIGEALGSNGLGFAIVGAFYILLSLVVLLFRKKLIERSLLRKLSEIYFKTDPEEENEQ